MFITAKTVIIASEATRQTVIRSFDEFWSESQSSPSDQDVNASTTDRYQYSFQYAQLYPFILFLPEAYSL